MPEPENKIASIAIFSNNASFCKNAATSLSAVPHCQVAVNKLEDIFFDLDASPLDLIILEIGDGDLLNDTRLAFLRQRSRALPLIVVSAPLPAERARSIVQLRADDWLQHPLPNNALLETTFNLLGGSRIAKCDVYGVWGAIGSPGSTVVAMTMADLLSRDLKTAGSGVCLIDLDFAAGACGAYLDLANDFDFDTIFSAPDRIDVELLELICHQVSDKLDVFSVRRPDLLLSPHNEGFVLKLLDVASYRYGAIVLDLPSYPTGWIAAIISELDRLLILSDTTIPSLRSAQNHCEFVQRHRRTNKGVHIVVNRERRMLLSRELTRSDMVKVSGMDIAAFLPDEPAMMSEALNQGILPSRLRPRSRFVKATRQLLANLRKSDQ